jgi:hypothetical protein
VCVCDNRTSNHGANWKPRDAPESSPVAKGAAHTHKTNVQATRGVRCLGQSCRSCQTPAATAHIPVSLLPSLFFSFFLLLFSLPPSWMSWPV